MSVQIAKWAIPAIVGVLASLEGTAHAAFTPLSCPSTGLVVQSDIGTDNWDFDPNPRKGNNYYSGQDHYWMMLVNPNVAWLKGASSLGSWTIEPGNDAFRVYHNNGTEVYSGTYAQFNSVQYTPMAYAGPQGAKHIQFEFTADSNTTFGRFNYFNNMTVGCASGSVSYAASKTISLNSRVDGLLLGTGDVIYGSFQAPASQKVLLHLEPMSVSSSADFDLYWSKVWQFPDDSLTFDNVNSGRSFTSAASEALYVPAGGTVYFGVHHDCTRTQPLVYAEVG